MHRKIKVIKSALKNDFAVSVTIMGDHTHEAYRVTSISEYGYVTIATGENGAIAVPVTEYEIATIILA